MEGVIGTGGKEIGVETASQIPVDRTVNQIRLIIMGEGGSPNVSLRI